MSDEPLHLHCVQGEPAFDGGGNGSTCHDLLAVRPVPPCREYTPGPSLHVISKICWLDFIVYLEVCDDAKRFMITFHSCCHYFEHSVKNKQTLLSQCMELVTQTGHTHLCGISSLPSPVLWSEHWNKLKPPEATGLHLRMSCWAI